MFRLSHTKLAPISADDFAIRVQYDIFLVADAEQVSTPEFIRRPARAAGTTPRSFPVPISLLRAALTICRRTEARDGLIGSLKIDISKATSTGWRPEITLDEGLVNALPAD